MSFIGGILGGGNILSSVLNIASMVFPALQMAASLYNMVSQAVGGAIKGAVDQLVENSGMPKFLGEAVKDLVDKIIGGNQKPSNPAVDEAMQDKFGDQMEKFMNKLMNDIVKDVNEARDEEGGKSTGKGGWLVALAKAFGKIADKAAKELETAGKNLNNENPSEMIEYQAKSQEFSQMMNTFTNAIKTIGEAMANTVRKG